MTAGADKILSFDPPGAIGLGDPDALLLLGFDETEDTAKPQDSEKVCEDFDAITTVMPVVVDGALGRARQFDGATTGLRSTDKVSGSTLVTRDLSIQVVLSWDAAVQGAAGFPGTIIIRGLAGSAAEYMAYGLRLDVVNAASFTASLRWFWQTTAGVDKLQTGADVVIRPNTFTMLTATRRWVSPTEVVLRYYVGDQLIGEVTSTDGSIGGGTTGAIQIGYRHNALSETDFYAGRIDEMMLVDRELCAEEIEATWLRITRYQPLGVQLFKEMFDPGFPISDEPGSDVQLDVRMTGQSIGYAAAQTENLRANFLPQRAYGTTLEQWEEAVRVTPKPAQDIAERRARVLARLRQRRGVSIPGIGDALEGLLGDGSVGDLEFLAFDNTIREPFATLDPLRWDITPAASWTAPAGTARSSPGAGTYLFDVATQNWRYARMSIGGDAKEARILAKVAMTTPQAALEVGLFFADVPAQNYILFGLRDDAGTFKLVSQRFVAGVSQGVLTRTTFGGNPANLWLQLYQSNIPGTWRVAWSTTSGTTGFTTSPDSEDGPHPTIAHWGGIYVRSTGAIGGAAQVDIDDLIMRQPFGCRPFNAYVLLDEALGFSPDIPGAQSVIAAIRHGYTHAAFITSRSVLCDNLESGCDLGCMGGI